jgi:hypothetical protein
VRVIALPSRSRHLRPYRMVPEGSVAMAADP